MMEYRSLAPVFFLALTGYPTIYYLYLNDMNVLPPLAYPDCLIHLDDGNSLFIPVPELVKPTYEDLLAVNPDTPFPFWARVWPAAKALTAFLLTEPQWIEGKHVIEIGAGLGLPSFAIAAKTASLIISDHAPEAVALLQKNIRHRKLEHVEALCLDWNHFPEHLEADTLLLSDINYAPDEFGALLQLIRNFLGKGTDIILATPQRLIANKFVDALQPYIIRTEAQMIEEGGQPVPVSIFLLSTD